MGVAKPIISRRGCCQYMPLYIQTKLHNSASKRRTHKRAGRTAGPKKRYSKALDKTPVEYLCPILKVVMTDPVMCSDGTTYDRKVITEWFKTSHKSPLTGKTLPSKKLTPNIALR